MSIGTGGCARMVLQDESTAIYEYYAYNLNDEKFRDLHCEYDGLVTIDKSSLAEPEIHEKVKKFPGGRKEAVIKRIPKAVDYPALLISEKIIVKNSRFCWRFLDNGTGYMAMRLVAEIYNAYQLDGRLPETVSCHM